MMRSLPILFLVLLLQWHAHGESLEEKVAASPGQPVYVEPGEHVIDAPLVFTQDGGGLYGPGRIVQADPAQAIVRVEHCSGVRIEGVTLTRAAEAQETTESALRAESAKGLVLAGVRVLENHSQSAAMRFDACEDLSIRDCEVLNYKTIGVDDRTTSPLYGYAFRCIDGAGIVVDSCVRTSIVHNRITEERLLPTPEAKAQYQLGNLCDGKQPLQPGELARGVAERGYVDNWHQGSAIVVTGPEKTRHTLIQGNQIVNAAQAIDLHCDYANVSNNVIDRCMIGIKGTHGCFGVVVSANTITGADLWGMVFNPGAASHAAEPATGDASAKPLNNDAGLLIANNLIADYGRGNDYWNWGGREADAPGSYGIAFLKGQLDSNPPLSQVVLTGNMVLAGGPASAAAGAERPRYRWAVYLEGWDEEGRKHPTAIEPPVLRGNLFQPGLQGVSNTPLAGGRQTVDVGAPS